MITIPIAIYYEGRRRQHLAGTTPSAAAKVAAQAAADAAEKEPA